MCITPASDHGTPCTIAHSHATHHVALLLGVLLLRRGVLLGRPFGRQALHLCRRGRLLGALTGFQLRPHARARRFLVVLLLLLAPLRVLPLPLLLPLAGLVHLPVVVVVADQ